MLSYSGHRVKEKAGFTLIEVLIASVLLGALFIGVTQLVTYARINIGRGLWLQKAITELRNTVRLISTRLKQANYPSMITDESGDQTVASYKERRSFERGRLTDLEVLEDTSALDVFVMEGAIVPSSSVQRIMDFAVCEPEKMIGGTHTPGKITWVVYQLESDPKTKFGRIRHIEWEETYDTRSHPDGIYGLNPTFSSRGTVPAGAKKINRIVVADVKKVEVDRLGMKESRGFTAAGEGVTEVERQRFMITFRVECGYPNDPVVSIGDQFTIASYVDVRRHTGGIRVTETVPPSQAKINGSNLTIDGTVAGFVLEKVYNDYVILSRDGYKIRVYKSDD